MKAILIVDVPEDYKWSIIEVKSITEDDIVLREIYLNKLKPMPIRKMHEEIIYANDKEYLRTNAFNDYERGYNACIDEMLEGEEE